jgi:hypothetical protein
MSLLASRVVRVNAGVARQYGSELQVRRAQVYKCKGSHSKLDNACSTHVGSSVGQSRSKTAAFGKDPAFSSQSPIYDAAVVGLEPYFYNTTVGSEDLSTVQTPFGFFSRDMKGFPLGFPIVLPVRLDEWMQRYSSKLDHEQYFVASAGQRRYAHHCSNVAVTEVWLLPR